MHYPTKAILTFPTSIGIFLVLVTGIASIVCSTTGKISRSYKTIASHASVTVNRRIVSANELAEAFKPELFLKPNTKSPPALAMWWEAIDTGNSIALIYHPVWRDERHPVALLNLIYRAYRAVVYGMPVRDIEYIQINVAKLDGEIQRIRYEGSSAHSYDAWINNHIEVTINRVGTQYIKSIFPSNHMQATKPTQIGSRHLQFGIATWSHQLTLLNDANVEQYTIPVDMSLEFMTDESYSQYKLARRSQGDFITADNAAGKVAKTALAVLVLGLPYLFQSFFYKPPSETDTQNSRS